MTFWDSELLDFVFSWTAGHGVSERVLGLRPGRQKATPAAASQSADINWRTSLSFYLPVILTVSSYDKASLSEAARSLAKHRGSSGKHLYHVERQHTHTHTHRSKQCDFSWFGCRILPRFPINSRHSWICLRVAMGISLSPAAVAMAPGLSVCPFNAGLQR